MGPYEPIPPNLDRDAYIESRIRIFGAFSSLYGTFTVNLGVFIPEVDEAQAAYFRPHVGGRAGFIPEYSCHIRERLGDLTRVKTFGGPWMGPSPNSVSS